VIGEFIDDYCGTPPHPHPWLLVAAEIAALGNSLREESLRAEMLDVATQVIRGGFASLSPSPAAATASGAQAAPRS
jgi:hypothetical protein